MNIEAERQAIEQLFVNVTLPIIVQDKGLFGIVGTATLFTIEDRPFLITAVHTRYWITLWTAGLTPRTSPTRRIRTTSELMAPAGIAENAI